MTMPAKISNEFREDRRVRGKIARLNKGFGFIEFEGVDYFFHWTSMSKFSIQFRNLHEGLIVEFNPGETNVGPKAFDVCTVDELAKG